jgi:hypothetical protein
VTYILQVLLLEDCEQKSRHGIVVVRHVGQRDDPTWLRSLARGPYATLGVELGFLPATRPCKQNGLRCEWEDGSI